METWLSHPIEISFDLWTLVFSLLICAFMIHQRKVLMRNNILFFFWFMVNAAFLVLKLEAYRNPELMNVLGIVSWIYLAVTVLVLAALAVSLHHGVKAAFHLHVQEWLYILVNTIGILFFLITGTSILEHFVKADTDANTMLISLVGFAPTLFALVVDLTYLREYHSRLRRSSPHMLYVFMIALVIASLIFSVFKGTGYTAGILTVAMMFGFVFYLLSLRRPGMVPAVVKEATAEPVTAETTVEEVKPAVLREFNETEPIQVIETQAVTAPEPVRLPAKEEPQPAPATKNGVSMLYLNPHFLYNTMNSVYYLVDQDTSLAKETIEDLSRYMQGKIEAAKVDHMIPMEGEMDMVKHYVSIMMLRYDDQLQVDFDLSSSGFLVPPLTIMSLVEYAVETEIRRSESHAKILVSTSKDNLCNRLSVAYAISPDEHVDKNAMYEESQKLREVKARLEQYCRGAMEILPEYDRVVLVAYLPLKSEENTMS